MYKFTKKIFILLLCSTLALDPFLLASAVVAQEVSPTPESVMITEPASAVTETESMVNTTQIDSNLESVVIPVTEESSEPIAPLLESPLRQSCRAQ
jgi:hypothetical protein